MTGLFDRLGIAEARVIRPETDIVSELVAKGEIELGMVVTIHAPRLWWVE
jgi:hypothetical protein